ncbi:MAG: ABC transporter permease [Gemmatimonadaceae bacterium]|nr:ABC transporter permease [Gemmatimonadaceae bacterium]
MRRLLAVARAYTLGMLTYRTRTLISLVSVLVAVIPVYFVAGALQPIAARAIASESTEYFTYLIVGSVASFVIAEAVSAIPSIVNSYITSGTLEQLLTTPIRWPSLIGGLSAYGFGWVALRALVLLVTAWIWATSTIAWLRMAEFMAIMGLLAIAYLGVGLVAGALVLAVRSSMLIPQGVLTVSALLGTVYFPVSVLPPVFAPLANVIPMTPALRAARQVLLKDEALRTVLPDLLHLGAWAVGGAVIGGLCFHLALQQARRAGTLTQY